MEKLSIPFWSDFITHKVNALHNRVITFQSHFGLILSTTSIAYHPQLDIAFNPILVWFYHFIVQLFQPFQTVLPLSIPFWSDFIHYHLLTFNTSNTHSFNPILVWFYHFSSSICLSSSSVLSIPFWSDFINILLPGAVTEEVTFNPILVWFYLFRSHSPFFLVRDFQSHFGLILSFMWNWHRMSERSTFNPILVWFYRRAVTKKPLVQ